MEIAEFVENIKFFCSAMGIKPTVACREAGVGSSFINNMEARGSMPSVDRVQLLAQYLGVTVSELIGETPQDPQAPADLSAEEWALLLAYRRADERARQVVDLTLEPFAQDMAKGAG